MRQRIFFGQTDAPIFREEMTRLQYQPGPLLPDTTYYWRVDQLTPSGIVVGTTWKFTTAAGAQGLNEPVMPWSECMQQPTAWYATPEAVRIADNVLLYQRGTGGWPKNIDMAVPLTLAGRSRVARDKRLTDSTIDNAATTTQIRFLARILEATKQRRFQSSILKGLRFLLAAQYPNGGWPQYYPLRNDYSRQITFNDDATVNVMQVLREVASGRLSFAFVDPPTRKRASDAMDRGVQLIVAAQIKANGKLTAWCAQHDATTLAPCKARSYELPSIGGRESVSIVRFLMGIDNPRPEIVRAIHGAIDWFRASAIKGWRIDKVSAPSEPRGFDYVLVADPAAPPLWARFYDIATNRPMFVGRDGIVKDRLQDIEYERRTGYTYLGPFAADLLQRDYPAWEQQRLSLLINPSAGKWTERASCFRLLKADITQRSLSEVSRQKIVGCDGNLPSRNFGKTPLNETALRTMSIVAAQERVRTV
jgi:PelA/Pel-15E family pectate lyase